MLEGSKLENCVKLIVEENNLLRRKSTYKNITQENENTNESAQSYLWTISVN